MQQTPTAIPEDFAEELLDKFLALRDVMQASDLIQELLDPLMTAEPPLVLPDVGRTGLASLLRIVNRDFATWLHGLEMLVEKTGRYPPSHE